MYDIYDIYDYCKILKFALENNAYCDFNANSALVYELKTKGSIDRYTGLNANSHHYTTKYHYEIVLPKLEEIFNFGFNKNDFVYKSNFYKEKDIKYDLSFFVPKKDKKFIINGLDYDISYECNFMGLLKNDKIPKNVYYTKYHELYAFPHSCSIIENISENNSKTIFISGDSQNIPHIPILAYYYKKVYYWDNREHKNHFHYIKNAKFDEFLICPFDKPSDFYLKII